LAFIDCHFYSDTLEISTAMYVILPQSVQTQIGLEGHAASGAKHPTLYLLHGLSDDHTIWMRNTSIERYASQLGIAIVMPAVNRSFYADMAKGAKYWSFISEELPMLARSFFPLSDARKDNFVAGLSMGGYGAFKWALNRPEQFAAAASLSGVMDLYEAAAVRKLRGLQLVFNQPSDILGSDSDLFALAAKRADSSELPMLYQCCGTEDFLYDENVRFHEHCRNLGIDLTYEEETGAHEWGYWDAKIQRVLKWLPLQKEIPFNSTI
jgi:putative tributyrin esterase